MSFLQRVAVLMPKARAAESLLPSKNLDVDWINCLSMSSSLITLFDDIISLGLERSSAGREDIPIFLPYSKF